MRRKRPQIINTKVIGLRINKGDVDRIDKIVKRLERKGQFTTRNRLIIGAIKDMLLAYGE